MGVGKSRRVGLPRARSGSTSPARMCESTWRSGIGPHRCIGSTLARLQLNTFFEMFVPASSCSSSTETCEYSSTTFVSTFKSLPIRLELADARSNRRLASGYRPSTEKAIVCAEAWRIFASCWYSGSA